MSILGNISFQHPLYLLLLLLIPIIGLWHYYKRPDRVISLTLPSLDALTRVSSIRGKLLFLIPLLRALAYTCIILALARPQLTLKEEEINAEGIDIIISMDTSSSMLDRDFRPNRIEVSKKLAAEFVTKRQHDRIGLVVFAAEAFTQCPLTTDHAVVRSFIKSLQCGMLEDGTAIGMGLASAVNRLKESEAKSRIIILLTDGLNSEGYINPETAADIAQEFGIKIYTIGIGKPGRFRNSIDEPLLRSVSEKTGGQYFRAQSESALAQIYDYIDQLEKTKVEVKTFKRYSEEFRRFLFWTLIFLGLEYLLKFTILKTFP